MIWGAFGWVLMFVLFAAWLWIIFYPSDDEISMRRYERQREQFERHFDRRDGD